MAALTLWMLGYPDQALARLHEALALAHALSHPYSLAWARCWAAWSISFAGTCRPCTSRQRPPSRSATEQGFPLSGRPGERCLRGWALAMQGQGEEGMAQVRQGIAAWRATGAALAVPYLLHLAGGRL